MEDKDWEKFLFQYEHCKKLAGVTTDSSSHLLECLSAEVYDALFSILGSKIDQQIWTNLVANIKKLVERKCNAMASIMKVFIISVYTLYIYTSNAGGVNDYPHGASLMCRSLVFGEHSLSRST